MAGHGAQPRRVVRLQLLRRDAAHRQRRRRRPRAVAVADRVPPRGVAHHVPFGRRCAGAGRARRRRRDARTRRPLAAERRRARPRAGRAHPPRSALAVRALGAAAVPPDARPARRVRARPRHGCPPHRVGRLVQGRLLPRARHGLLGLHEGRGARAPRGHPRLHRLRRMAARMARERRAGPPAHLLASAAGRRAAGALPADRPPPPRNAVLPRRPHLPLAQRGAHGRRARACPRQRRHAVHDAARRSRRRAPPLVRADGRRHRHADRGPFARRAREHHRLFHQHGRAAHARGRRPDVHRAALARALDLPGCVRQPGRLVQAGRAGGRPVPRPEPLAAVPGVVRPAECGLRAHGTARPHAGAHRQPPGGREVRPVVRHGRARRQAAHLAGVRGGSVRPADDPAAAAALRARPRGRCRRPGRADLAAGPAERRGARAAARRLERDRGADPGPARP